MHRGSLLLALAAPMLLLAQSAGVLTVKPVEKPKAKRNDVFTVKVTAELKQGYHANSNTPSDAYMIPLKLTWQAAPLQVEEISYPKPQMEKYDFAEKPLSVVTGSFDILTKFKAPPTVTAGPILATGKLRYQACTNQMCLPPKTVEVPLTIEIQ